MWKELLNRIAWYRLFFLQFLCVDGIDKKSTDWPIPPHKQTLVPLFFSIGLKISTECIATERYIRISGLVYTVTLKIEECKIKDRIIIKYLSLI